MVNFSAHLSEHCTRSKRAQPGDRELFFGRPQLNVSRLRRPGAIRAQPLVTQVAEVVNFSYWSKKLRIGTEAHNKNCEPAVL